MKRTEEKKYSIEPAAASACVQTQMGKKLSRYQERLQFDYIHNLENVKLYIEVK